MTTNAPARWPAAPDDIRSLTGTDAFDAAAEVVFAQTIADFQRTLRMVDGTRSEQVGRWTAEIFTAVGGES